MTDMPDEKPTLPPPPLDDLMRAAAENTWRRLPEDVRAARSFDAHVTEYSARWRGALAREAGIGHFPGASQ